MKQTIFFFLFMFTSMLSFGADRNFQLQSPDGNIRVEIVTGDQITYSISVNNQQVLAPSPISMTLADGKILGTKVRVTKENRRSNNNIVKPLFENASEIRDEFNELILNMAGNYALIFRVYNNGAAYRFSTSFKGRITIQDEQVQFNIKPDTKGYFIEVNSFENSYEDNYKYQQLSAIDSGKLAILPAYIETDKSLKLIIAEADLLDYPGFYLTSNETGLKGNLPKYPKNTQLGGNKNFNLQVTEREDFLAQTNGTRTFPWRLVIIENHEKEFLHNHLVYLLSTPSKINDVSWIRPGKVAWDWWNALNLSGVEFKTGFNTETYKYFIDFAANNNIEYVNLDEGWSDQHDLLKVTTQLDMPEVIRYAQEKNVKLILWCVWHVLDRQMQVETDPKHPVLRCVWHVLDRQMQEALDQFEKWGIAGVKVDFMDRDDQKAVNFYENLAVEAAKRKLIVNFHGAYKPTGLRRTYPNVINREAVLGLEYNKWSNQATPEHNVTIPFIRMVAGPMDYTPGAMRNAAVQNFRALHEMPMSQGTRCHQLAMFVVYDAPLQMLADAPTAYEREPEILDYLADVPNLWDETKVIDGKIADYIIMGRRKGGTWYLGAMTDNEERKLNISFDFLNDGNYTAEIFQDGINADRNGIDYVKKSKDFNKSSSESILLLPGGGWVAKITPVK